jgi:hypothetical protein
MEVEANLDLEFEDLRNLLETQPPLLAHFFGPLLQLLGQLVHYQDAGQQQLVRVSNDLSAPGHPQHLSNSPGPGRPGPLMN